MNWLNHLSGGSCGGGRAILPPFPRITVASHPTYGTIAPAFTESCPSGRRSTIGNRVGAKSVSRVQIPDSPPELSAARIQLDRVPFSHPTEEWQSGCMRRSRKPFTGTPRTRVRIPPPPPSLVLSASPSGSFFCISTLGHDSRDAVGVGRFIGVLLLSGNPDSASSGRMCLRGFLRAA